MSSSGLLLNLETEKPSKEIQEKALLELRETPDKIEMGLRKLKQLLEVEQNLCAPLTNDDWLLMFLRTCKFYPESARDLIKSYYSTRLKYPEVTKLLIPAKLKPVFDENLVSILPQRDQCGRRIVHIIIGRQWNYRTIKPAEILASILLCLDILQKEPSTQINGTVYIMDMEGTTLRHTMNFTPYRLKRCMDFIQDHSPLRMKGLHIVNQPRIVQPFFTLLKSFANSKFSKRILMHGNNYESLHQYISPECLPKCYGGILEMDLCYSSRTYEILAGYEDLFNDLTKFGLGMNEAET